MSLRVASRPSAYICRSCRRDLTRTKRRRFGTNSITSNPEEVYDIVTVGGGPVGLALLTALSTKDYIISTRLCTDSFRIISNYLTSQMCINRNTTSPETKIMGSTIRPILESRKQHHTYQPDLPGINRSMASSRSPSCPTLR